ncbi:hypothetical protein PanWU01x14_352420 [Parasponia andersonii]|uniref:Uncharacterized protein n=1 Tax=Parasponia andersonii TaxID=3476 RepID=A0A2P5AA95_PARAD|nr:hypothetical protein PanWU01x14_352420 [Parasponia andersonii]
MGESLTEFCPCIQRIDSTNTGDQRSHGGMKKVWCDYCHKPHHTKETCWKLHRKPLNWKGNKPNRESRGFQAAEIQEALPSSRGRHHSDHLGHSTSLYTSQIRSKNYTSSQVGPNPLQT